MVLQNSLYEIERKECTEKGAKYQLSLNGTHFIYKAHKNLLSRIAFLPLIEFTRLNLQNQGFCSLSGLQFFRLLMSV